ncbi:hypothetical protein ATERTT37_007485 [Aspergillus terreus]
MSYACRPISEEVDTATIDASWAKCEEILRQMGSFSLSARNTLQFLQVARARVLSTPQDPPSAAAGNTATPARQHVSSQPNQGPALYKGRPGAKLKWFLGIVAVDITMLEKPPTVCVKDWGTFAEDEALKDTYDAPEEFRPIARGKDLNGSFFSDYTIDEDDTPTYHVSWATYKAKLVRSEHDYNWVQTTVLVKWKIPSQIEVVFLNLEDKQKKHIVKRLPTEEKRQFHPFTWHALLAGSIIGLYDMCFWLLRDLKREVTSQPSRDLARQHDIARHIFHLSEVLEVTENTLKNLVSEHRRFREEFQDLTEGKRGVIINTQQKLFFVEKEIHSQRMRARSLTERLNNELNLGIFGTNFFDYNAPSDDRWATSNKFWVYWAVTVPLTAITLILWAWWHSMPRKWVKQINYYWEKRKEDPMAKRSRTNSGMTV